MGRHILVLYVLLSVLCVHISTGGRLAHGQHIDLSNFSPVAVGYGGRALAMGGSCLAFVDDATAISCNPSGLTKVYNSQALFCGRFTFGSHQPHLSETAIDGAVLETARASRFVPELVALVFPLQQLNQNIVGGLAVREVFDLSHETLYKYGNLDDVDGQHGIFNRIEDPIPSLADAITVPARQFQCARRPRVIGERFDTLDDSESIRFRRDRLEFLAG